MIVRNPPFVLEGELSAILPELARCMSVDNGAGWRVEAISGEQGVA